jgi:hypothetical protein
MQSSTPATFNHDSAEAGKCLAHKHSKVQWHALLPFIKPVVNPQGDYTERFV